jgi:uncharacterized membrane protein
MANHTKTIRKGTGFIWSLFINGLCALLPITVTFALLRFCYHLLKNWLEPIHRIEPSWLTAIPNSEIIIVTLFIFIIGALIKYFLLGELIHGIESVLFRKIPLIKQIYFGIKQLTHAFNTSKNESTDLKEVVLIEFPRTGVYTLAFVTGYVSPHFLQSLDNQTYVSVFCPHAPNPTGGFYLILPQKDCLHVDLSRQEALAIILSGGLVQPDRFNTSYKEQ